MPVNKRNKAAASAKKQTAASRFKSKVIDLTAKELHCLREICRGKSMKRIAHDNGHTISTVQTRLRRIMAKLNTENRVEMILIAASRELIPCPCRLLNSSRK